MEEMNEKQIGSRMMTNFLQNTTFQIYDTSTNALREDSLSHFAMGDALLRLVNEADSPSFLHFWPIEDMIILGMMDTKLPYLEDGIQLLEQAGYTVRVRPAGGLGVVADEGILNLSLILAEDENEKISIDDGYEVMLALVRQVFAPFGKKVEAYEIPDSYCPGTYDLSIDGKKFAGIAQRRFKHGIGIMMYLSIEGDQKRRGERMRDFYAAGLKGEETRWKFPAVNPDSMANLTDLLGVPLSVPQVKEMIVSTLVEMGNQLVQGAYGPELMNEYQSAHEKLVKRNEQIFEKSKRR